MARGKHSSNEEFDFDGIPWKKILLTIVIIGIVIGVLFGGKAVYSSFIANGKLFSKKVKEENKEIVIEEKMPTELYGYKVLGQINIENKNYSSYILEAFDDKVKSKSEKNTNLDNMNSDNTVQDGDEISEKIDNEISNDEADVSNNNSEKYSDALKKGLVKLYGDKLNQKGNFTIMGHNDEKYFSVLNELEIGDEFSIKTPSNIEKNYIITSIETIEPTDLKSLMPNKEYTEVTLITCSTGSNQRLVVKALEETDYEISKAVNKESDISEENQEKVEENDLNSIE